MFSDSLGRGTAQPVEASILSRVGPTHITNALYSAQGSPIHSDHDQVLSTRPFKEDVYTGTRSGPGSLRNLDLYLEINTSIILCECIINLQVLYTVFFFVHSFGTKYER